MDNNELTPLNISMSKGVLNGNIYDIVSLEEYKKYKNTKDSSLENMAVETKTESGEEVILPVITDKQYSDNVLTPGVYPVGPISVLKYPREQDLKKYQKSNVNIINFSNNDSLEEILTKKESLRSFSEPWVTSTDSTTICPISEEDQPEMKAIKAALNAKHVDFNAYAPRFGQNFPNNKRQLNNNSATLKFIKTFCECLDLDAELTLKDKNPNVPNPMGKVIHVSLTDLAAPDNNIE